MKTTHRPLYCNAVIAALVACAVERGNVPRRRLEAIGADLDANDLYWTAVVGPLVDDIEDRARSERNRERRAARAAR